MNRVKRRKFLIATGALLAAPFGANSQPREKIYRIGYILTAVTEHATRAFEQGLRELGYVEGRNIVFERRYAGGKQELLPQLAAELVRLNVDIIVTGANPVVAAVKQATATIPVVMTNSRDPVGSGFIASLARPGGNITGLAGDPTPEILGKNVAFLKEAVPKTSRVALLRNPLAPAAEIYTEVIERAGQKLGLRMRILEIRGRDELESAFAAMARDGIDAVVVHSDPVLFTARAQLVALTIKHRLPSMYPLREYVDAGGLMSYGADLADNFRRAAVYVDKILKGAKPGELPIEQPTRFEFVVNLKTAKAFGLTIPQSVMARADEVIR